MSFVTVMMNELSTAASHAQHMKRVAAKRARAAERRQRWQSKLESEKENLAMPTNSNGIEVLAESYRHAQMRFFLALFDDSLALGQFVAKSLLIDEYIATIAFEYLARSRLDMRLWAENVHFALVLAVQMQEDLDDFGFIEIVKCWVEMHGGQVQETKPNEFIISSQLINCFNCAKNLLWHRLEFNLNVAPEVVVHTLTQLKAHVDYVQELRANQGMRLWIDRDPPRARVPTRASTRQATEQPAVHTAARGIDVSFMPSPPQHIDGRCRVSKTSVQQRGSPTDSSSYTENDDSNRTNSSRRSSNKRLMNASPCAHARSKARNRSPPESQTGGGLAFLTHFFME